MKKREKYYFDVKIKIARALFFTNALLWLGFGIFMFRQFNSLSKGASPFLVAFFLLVIAGSMLASGIMIANRIRWAYYFAMVALAMNIVLNFFGLFGILNFISVLLDIVLIMILISFTRLYFENA